MQWLECTSVRLANDQHQVDDPALCEFFTRDEGRQVVNEVEKKLRCVIEVEAARPLGSPHGGASHRPAPVSPLVTDVWWKTFAYKIGWNKFVIRFEISSGKNLCKIRRRQAATHVSRDHGILKINYFRSICSDWFSPCDAFIRNDNIVTTVCWALRAI